MRSRLLKLIMFILIFNIAILPSNVFSHEDDKVLTICIDAGHQKKADFKGEPIYPGSSNKKARVSAGTVGVATKKPEYEVNLQAALKLRDILVNEGFNVVMIREINEVNISNAERANIANEAMADMTIRLHCDSIDDSNKRGAVILVPSQESNHTNGIYDESHHFAELLKKHLKENNIKVNGIHQRKDITGFNWSKVPVIILEMGFMSNHEEDRMLSDESYQTKMMNCISDALKEYRDTKNNYN